MSVKVVVIGGVVMDLEFWISALPKWKEAVQANKFHIDPGGKGLNQAVAASRLGAEVSIISAIGGNKTENEPDQFGLKILDVLHQENINNDFVQVVEGESTAVTAVFVNDEAESSFIGWKSVTNNKRVICNLIEQSEKIIRNADALMITLEVPVEAIEKILRIARHAKAIPRNHPGPLVLLNPAPPAEPHERAFVIELMKYIDILVPNAWEASQLLPLRQREDPPNPEKLASQLHHQLRVPRVCVTASDIGCFIATEGKVTQHSPFVSMVVDTVGGSDAFCAALVVGMAEGKKFFEAVDMANAAGSLAVQTRGGYPSMPTRKQVNELLATHKTLK